MFNKTDIEKYFIAEKSQCLTFVFIGIAAVIISIIFFFFLKTNFYKGIALPLFLIAIIQITVGYTVYKRSDTDRKQNTYAYDMNPSQLKNKELPRMEKVNRNFVLFRWMEIILIIAGIIMIVLYRSNIDKAFLFGLGVGILIQSIILFTADSFAASRAKLYTDGLKVFTKKI